MNLIAKFCDPFKPEVQELGSIKSENVMAFFERIPWTQLLDEMANSSGRDIYYSPSLVIENTDINKGIEIAAVGENNWYIFYTRTREVKTMFNLGGYKERLFFTEIRDQSNDVVRSCLFAFINQNFAFLEEVVNS